MSSEYTQILDNAGHGVLSNSMWRVNYSTLFGIKTAFIFRRMAESEMTFTDWKGAGVQCIHRIDNIQVRKAMIQ